MITLIGGAVISYSLMNLSSGNVLQRYFELKRIIKRLKVTYIVIIFKNVFNFKKDSPSMGRFRPIGLKG